MKMLELTTRGIKETTVLIGEKEELADKFGVYFKNIIQNPQAVRGIDGDIVTEVVITDLD
jgi:hypothetical protein